jgi:YHS domain-containing protein
MSGLTSFLIFALLFFLMMRVGCGAHVGHGHHGGHDDQQAGPGGVGGGSLMASVDPVCGMRVEGDTGYARMYRGAAYRFCSRDCLDKFDAAPDQYATRDAGTGAHGGHGA